MMKNITFSFPKDTEFAANFFDNLVAILRQVPHTPSKDAGITLSVLEPDNAFPVTNFRLDDHSNFPRFYFDFDEKLAHLAVGLNVESDQPEQSTPKKKPLDTTVKHDDLGIYYAVTTPTMTLYRLPIEEVRSRLEGHITRVDHTGVNLSSKRLGRADWEAYIRDVARESNLYRYPTGEEWLFVLPATEQEFETDITTFPIGRGPKFELVYDTLSPVTTYQIDIETDLERQEVERLFPEPYSVSFPDLADYFRTVYVHHEWPGLNIRFDIRFKNTAPGDDWETGKWLVNDGGRIKQEIS